MTLRPLHTLLHPLWLGALAVLVLNDHVLKGAGLVPAAATGKISDVAGLIVAPALLAVLVGVDRQRGWTAAHLAVGAVFAAIQLAPIAGLWDAALGSLGVGWVTTPDPSDWLALPALLVSWTVLGASATPRRLSPAQRGVATLGLGAGMLACTATSPVRPVCCGESFFPAIEAQAWIHNDSIDTRIVRLRQLRSDVEIGCPLLTENDPGAVLSDDLFEPAVEWELPPRTTVSALPDPRVFDATGCHAVLVEGDTFDSHVLVWHGVEPQVVNGEVQPGETMPWGRFSIPDLHDDDGIAWPLADAPFGQCDPPSELERLEWTEPVVDDTWRLVAAEASPDGCLALDLEGSFTTDRVYACMPEDLFPFERGDVLEISEQHRAAVDLLRILRPEDAHELALATLSGPGSVLDLDADPLVDPDACGLRVHEDGCDTVSVPALVALAPFDGSDEVFLRSGDRKTFVHADDTLTVVDVVRAEKRVVADRACGVGPTGAVPDVHLVVQTLPNPDDLPTE